MRQTLEIEIPYKQAELILIEAARQEISVEELAERAIKKYIERNDENAV